MAGPGAMKGVSPIDRRQQAITEIQEYIDRHLVDAAGILSGVLLRQVKDCELLLNSTQKPLAVLAGYVQKLLESEYCLKELVREADVEWGRLYGERPFFEKEGSAPSPNDPYTVESIRCALTELARGLAS